jgi:hypothetical protein
MSDLNDQLKGIFEIIKDVEDEGVRNLLTEGFGLVLKTLDQVARKSDREEIDISEQIQMVSSALNFPIEDLIMYVLEVKFANQNNSGQPEGQYQINSKEADEETLDFITSDVDTDDYESFLEDNKVKENLEFLKKEI